jgi:hypothetical protein
MVPKFPLGVAGRKIIGKQWPPVGVEITGPPSIFAETTLSLQVLQRKLER